jgi:1,4-alpha-glucan branching enzyme
MVKKKLLKSRPECEVTFELAAAGAKRVALVCESNGWKPIEMRRSGRSGPFRARVRLPKDERFQFRYLVDGASWINDEAADAYWPNEFGSENGVLDTKQAH